MIPLWDVDLAVAEVKRCAAKGSHNITFSENPVPLGLPSLHSGHWEKLFAAYDIPCRFIRQDENEVDALRQMLSEHHGPQAWIVQVDPQQPNWPAVSTTLTADGSLTSKPLYDMLPKLSEELLARVGRYLI